MSLDFNTSLRRRLVRTGLCCGLLLSAGCGSQKIAFVYPDEALDFQLRHLKTPAVYIDTVTDLRPAAQREGEGHFFTITFPKDEAWEVPATQIYAEALAQDLEQTHLVELVPLQAQADYVLSLDLMSLACQVKRSPAAFLLTGAIGAGAGMALGGDGSHRVKLGAVLAAVGMLVLPVPTDNTAEAEVRLTLKDRSGDILWQKSCLGSVEGRKYLTATAREDQQLVNEQLTKAVKRANACLLGQMRQYLLENAAPAASAAE
jgi:asparagine synthetase B (glutamine-hydrolysing)